MEAGLFSNQGRENRRQITSEKRENFEEKDIHTSKILKMKRESRCNLALTYLGMVYLPQVLGPSPCIFCRAYRPHPGACPTSGGEPHTNSYRTCTTSRSEYTRYPAGEMETESGSCSRVLVPSNPKFYGILGRNVIVRCYSTCLRDTFELESNVPSDQRLTRVCGSYQVR